MQWGSVPPPDQNGIILSYTVTYQALPGGSPRTIVVNTPITEAKLTELNPNTNYSITVFASTVKGDGSVSTPIAVLTDLNRKFTQPLSYCFNSFSKTFPIKLFCLLSESSISIINNGHSLQNVTTDNFDRLCKDCHMTIKLDVGCK